MIILFRGSISLGYKLFFFILAAKVAKKSPSLEMEELKTDLNPVAKLKFIGSWRPHRVATSSLMTFFFLITCLLTKFIGEP